jgi:hypothetical protein
MNIEIEKVRLKKKVLYVPLQGDSSAEKGSWTTGRQQARYSPARSNTFAMKTSNTKRLGRNAMQTSE